MAKKLKKIPQLRSEAAERKFWETHDTTDYLDWSKAQRVRFPNLILSTWADRPPEPKKCERNGR
jgi:CopG antitoxin of type II toxin-antitoxin system